MKQRAEEYFTDLQDRICDALEGVDGKSRFLEDRWQREGGGGGRTRVIENGAVFEKGGVNFSSVFGELPPAFASRIELGEGNNFTATGISLVLHPTNPHVPTIHANFRYLEKGDTAWFGGGTDLTPYYPRLDDVIHFHRTLRASCDRHDTSYYPRFKKWCDEYFFIKHRNESRGVGGVFFDYLQGDMEQLFSFVRDLGDTFLETYLPIIGRRRDDPYTEREKEFQLIRRGRYVEFNLVYDRGTTFGLETRGRTESILMSLPPLARWSYDYHPQPGTPEADAWEYFKPRDWLG
jgi:coproporphyrinogen III oxidase